MLWNDFLQMVHEWPLVGYALATLLCYLAVEFFCIGPATDKVCRYRIAHLLRRMNGELRRIEKEDAKKEHEDLPPWCKPGWDASSLERYRGIRGDVTLPFGNM